MLRASHQPLPPALAPETTTGWDGVSALLLKKRNSPTLHLQQMTNTESHFTRQNCPLPSAGSRLAWAQQPAHQDAPWVGKVPGPGKPPSEPGLQRRQQERSARTLLGPSQWLTAADRSRRRGLTRWLRPGTAGATLLRCPPRARIRAPRSSAEGRRRAGARGEAQSPAGSQRCRSLRTTFDQKSPKQLLPQTPSFCAKVKFKRRIGSLLRPLNQPPRNRGCPAAR